MMLYTATSCTHETDFNRGMVIGYASMIIAFSFVFVGVKNFRDKYNDGVISFGKAFQTGLYIVLIASTFYVVSWLIDYYCFMPDFMEKYSAHVLSEAKASGASAAEIDSKLAEMAKYAQWYKNPFLVILMTYAEILPVGLVFAIISALIFKRKAKDADVSVVG